MSLYYCGIDPGLSGALAVLDHAGSILHVADLPTLLVGKTRMLDLSSIRTLLPNRETSRVTLEKVDVRPAVGKNKDGTVRKQGIVSSGRFMRATGQIEGMLAMGGYSVELVTPQAWKKVMMAGMAKEKDASRLRCSQVWPDMAALWRHKKDHHRCDALLLAEYLRRIDKGA